MFFGLHLPELLPHRSQLSAMIDVAAEEARHPLWQAGHFQRYWKSLNSDFMASLNRGSLEARINLLELGERRKSVEAKWQVRFHKKVKWLFALWTQRWFWTSPAVADGLNPGSSSAPVWPVGPDQSSTPNWETIPSRRRPGMFAPVDQLF